MKRADSILANFYMSKKRPIEDPRGQWDHPGEVTRIPSNKITMQGVPYPVLGVGSNGKKQMMYPGEDYTFNGANYVDEYPVMKSGGLLSRSVTCSNCGHSWKATDGGVDPLTCHKCGGMIKMKQGGQTKNERDMVNGIADILSKVTDPQNRAQIAQEMVKDFNNEDVTYDYNKFMELSNLKNGGEMIRRADGSYSRRGLWDNIRANKGSSKKPTKEMLEQERKIKRSMQTGGLWNTNRTQWVDSVNNANMDQNFVQRFYLKNGPSIQIPGERGTSTHFMEESDGMVYPTVVQMPNGKLQYLNLNDKNAAYNYAKKTGQFIKFPTVEQARWYGGNGYKTGTGVTIGKKQMGGYISKYQTKGQVDLSVIPTQEMYMGRPVGNKLAPPPLGMSIPFTTEAQRYSNYQKSHYTPDTIGPAAARRSKLGKGLAMVAHPMTTAQYLVKNQDIPDYLEKNPNVLDYATPFVNPASSVYSGFQVPGNLNRGEYGQASLNALSILPGLKLIPKGTRAAINFTDKNFSKVGKALNQIEKEGLAVGMSDFDIAKRQLDNVGITSNQRQAYFPGLSEFARKYVTPYGYIGGGHNKLEEVLQNIKNKGVNYSSIAPERSDAWNMYLGFPQKNKTFRLSETAPINHSAYSSKQLKDMDVYNLSGEQLIADDILSDAEYPNPNHIEKNFDALKNSSFVRTDPNKVMGNYNLRFTDEGLQYNDVWDLNPEITPLRYLPYKLRKFAENSSLFNKTIVDKHGQYSQPRTIKIDIGKFLGKPFMSHGNIPSITKESFKESFQKGLVERLNEAKELQKNYGYDMTPKIENIQKQIKSINHTR